MTLFGIVVVDVIVVGSTDRHPIRRQFERNEVAVKRATAAARM
jgi:hypothetical protein